MSYSRWITSTFYTYWCVSDAKNKNDELDEENEEPEMPKMEYEQRNDPDHPYCTNWPMNKKKEKKDENV